MRTDYFWKMPEPSDEVKDWARSHPDPGAVMDWSELAKPDSDVPVHVREYARCVVAAANEWDATACDRPYSIRAHNNDIRFFDGPWIPAHRLTLPIVANSGDFQHVAHVSRIYRRLVAEGDEVACRRVAAAFYEYLDKSNEARMAVIRACTEPDESLN